MKNKLKIERAIHSMTQSELAAKTQVSRQTIYAIEAGEYNLSTLLALKIATVFETSIESLFELEKKDWK